MHEGKPSFAARITWWIWGVWYAFWRWVTAMLCAPFWAFRLERQLQLERNLFAREEAAQEAALRHLRETMMRIEDAFTDRALLELGDPAAEESADTALQAFLRRLVEIESPL